MKYLEVIKSCNALGIKFSVRNDKLAIHDAQKRMTSDLLQQLKAHKQEILEWLQAGDEKTSQIKPRQNDEAPPLSFAQQRLWFIHEIEGHSSHYHIPVFLNFSGNFDIDALQNALAAVMQRHEVLRTNIISDNDQAVQRIQAEPEVDITQFDYAHIASDEQDTALKSLAQELLDKPFDLARDPLIRLATVRLSEAEHAVLLIVHHLVADGWSVNILVKEFSHAYAALEADKQPAFAPLTIQYADYAAWQREQLSGAALDNKLQFWKSELADFPQLHSLPLDKPRSLKQHYQADLTMAEVDATTINALKALATQCNTTLFTLMQTALALAIGRFSRTDDVMLAVPSAGRNQPELEAMIGLFVNTLPVRTRWQAGESFRDLLVRQHSKVKGVFGQQDMPFELLVEAINPSRDLSYNPISQIKFVIQNYESGTLDIADTKVKSLDLTDANIRFDIDVTCVEHNKGLNIQWHYKRDLFAPQSMESLLHSYQALLSHIAQTPDMAVDKLPMLMATTVADSKTDAQLKTNATLVSEQKIDVHNSLDRIVTQAERTPDAIAVHDNYGNQWSYRALLSKADRLATSLLEQGLEPGERIAVLLQSHAALLVSMLAIWRIGGSYIPLDTSNARSRIEQILDDVNLDMLLTLSEHIPMLNGIHLDIVLLDDIEQETWLDEYQEVASDELLQTSEPQQEAYVIYTSGSTGIPKGVSISHANLDDYLSFALAEYYQSQLTGSLVVTSHSFDITVPALFLPLMTGGKVTLADTRNSVDALASALKTAEDEQYLLRLTPNHVKGLQWLLEDVVEVADTNHSVSTMSAMQCKQHVFVIGGEALHLEVATELAKTFPQATLYNHYGPTEGTVGCLYFAINDTENLHHMPVGQPMPNVCVRIEDQQGQLLPIGAIGELVIGGPGISSGYLNRPEENAEKFFQLDSPAPNTRYYRTGDLVRLGGDNQLQYVGRADSQLKLLGYRIEPGEIEQQLLTIEGISSALVQAQQEQLIAYIEVGTEQVLTEQDIKGKLQEQLPAYMVPANILMLDAMPLNDNGKIDTSRLPSLESKPKVQARLPESDGEKLLAQIWEKILKVENISVSDDFFALGGHSLLATQVVNEIRKQSGEAFSVRDLFDHPNIESFATLLTSNASDKTAASGIPLAPQDQDIALSAAQKRIWLTHQLDGQSAQYNMPFPLQLDRNINVAALQRALNQLVQRHTALITAFVDKSTNNNSVGDDSVSDNNAADGGATPVQQVHRDASVEIVVENVDENVDENAVAPAATSQNALKQAMAVEAAKPFDLSEPQKLRCRLFSRAEQHQVLMFTFHHSACDGWSMAIFWRELGHLYAANLRGNAATLPELPLQYRDYSHWQNQWLNHAECDAQWQYWQQKLADLPAVHSLPLDTPRPLVKQYDGAMFSSDVSGQLSQQLLLLASQLKLTPFMLIHTALSMVLARHSNSTDIVIGTPFANRSQSELESLIGYFANTIVLRINTQQGSILQMFEEVKQTHLDAQANQDIPFDQLVEKLRIERSSAITPLFQIMLTTNTRYNGGGGNNQNSDLLPGLTQTEGAGGFAQAKFDLHVDMVLDDQGGNIQWTYDTHLFNEATMVRLNQHLHTLLTQLACLNGQPENQLAQLTPAALSLLSQEESRELVTPAQIAGSASHPLLIQQLFEQQAAATPDASALIYGTQTLSYRQVNQQANQLARLIRTQLQDTAPEAKIGLHIDRSPAMVIAILATLKAGCAYVPLDPDYPAQRLQFIAQDASLSLILNNQPASSNVELLARPCIDLTEFAVGAETLTGSLTNLDDSDLGTDLDASGTLLSPNNLAYIIYTSGSTGQPKGVMIEHRHVVHYLEVAKTYPQHAAFTGVLSSSLNFDATVTSLFTPLITGNPLRVIPEENLLQQLAELMASGDRHLFKITPAHLQGLNLSGVNQTEHTLVIGGEQLTLDVAQRVTQALPNAKLINEYGPTEGTVGCIYSAFVGAAIPVTQSGSDVAIGAAMPHVSVQVLDPQGALVPKGAIGELYLGGAALARGYLGQPQLSAEKFRALPADMPQHDDQTTRLYRTGDLVQYLADGSLAFCGRIDEQVKIRGYRIEPGEIEQCASALPDVVNTVVLVKDKGTEDAQLIAFVHTQTLSADAVRQHLVQSLPAYMVPAHIVTLSELPLTVNGKVDRNTLLENFSLTPSESRVAPQTELENTLHNIWSQQLKLPADSFGVTDNFFSLGGHSLLAIRLVTQIKEELQVELHAHDLFNNPSIVQLAALLEQSTPAQDSLPLTVQSREGLIPLSFGQQRLWFLDQLQGGSPEYNMPAAFKVAKDIDLETVHAAMTLIIQRHEVLRTHYGLKDGTAHQVVNHDFELDIPRYALPEAQLQQFVAQQAAEPFTLSQGLMVRLSYIDVEDADDYGVLLFNIHHIAADGWSLEILGQEFQICYQALVSQQQPVLPELEIQYADYTLWQRQRLSNELLAQQATYWETQLSDVPTVHNLPLDHERPSHKTYKGDIVFASLPAQMSADFQALALRFEMTPFMLLHTTLALFMSAYSNEAISVVGTPVANRNQKALNPLMGYFAGTSVLKADCSQDTLKGFLAHIKETHLAAKANEDVPFEQIVEQLNIPRSPAYHPLFQIMLITRHDYDLETASHSKDPQKNDSKSNGELLMTPLSTGNPPAKFDLTVDFNLSDKGLGLELLYDVALFDRATVERMSGHLLQLLQNMVQLSQQLDEVPLQALTMLAPEQSQQLKTQFNNTARNFDNDLPVHERFAQWAEQQPSAVAVTTEQGDISYGELEQRATLLASQLVHKHGVVPGQTVGLYSPRSLDMVVALLGVLKAGAAYVPIDPMYPKDRIEHMVRVSQCKLLLHTVDLNSELQLQVSCLDASCLDKHEDLAHAHPQNTAKKAKTTLPQVSLSNPAYYIFTSGSTGLPKAVVLSHKGARNLSWSQQHLLQITPESRVLQYASFSFDAATWEWMMALTNGASLHIVPETVRANPQALGQYLMQQNISHLTLPPSLLVHLEHHQNYPFEKLVVAGEAIDPGVASLWSRDYCLINAYGPTETTVCATMGEIHPEKSVTIGTPICNTQVHIINGLGQMQPAGVPGEIVVFGDGVANGYLGAADKDNARFVDFEELGRGYRTGDHGYWNENGELVYLGRQDRQLKVRGHRVEPGEIEAVLNKQPEISQSAVVYHQESQNLIAFIVEDNNARGEINDTMEILKASLPAHYIPGHIQVLKSLPITRNGKTDYAALQQLEITRQYDARIAPQTKTQQRIAKHWCELLNLDPDAVHIKAFFFEQGGHSLLMVRLKTAVEAEFAMELEFQQFYQYANIEDLAKLVEYQLAQQTLEADDSDVDEDEFEEMEF